MLALHLALRAAPSSPALARALCAAASSVPLLKAGDRAALAAALSAEVASGALLRAAETELGVPRALFPSVAAALRRRLASPAAEAAEATDAAKAAAAAAAAATAAATGAAAVAESSPPSLSAAAPPAAASRLWQVAQQAHAALAPSAPEAAAAAFRASALSLLRRVVEESAVFGEAVEAARLQRASADLRAPHTWYPRARALRRRIIFHAGPTNSGKTYRALEALKRAHSGAYCGPLRLLALEVFESLNGDGVYTSLATGQERREMPFARHVACTVEMLSTETRMDVVVIDEIQMIGDRQRGSAWTRALLGAVAPEVHVCGDPAALPALAALAALCGDALEVVRYERMTELTPAERSLDSDYARIEAGDCVVAFSRKDVYAIRRTIERKTAHRCCVIYGSLPPETRSQQSRLFNDADSGFRVLVATDAVGMGLNLNIRRVVFHAMDKFDGEAVGPVPPAHVKQIAGRAGRRSSRFPRGWATALHPADLPYLHSCLAAPPAPIAAAGLFPNAEQLIRFAELLPPDTPFSALIAKFVSASHLDGPYFMCRDSTIKQVAALLQPFPLSLPERCALALVPMNLRNINVRAYFSRFLAQFCAGVEVRLDLQLPLASPSYLGRDLEALETKVQTLDVYLWLGQRLGPFGFPDLSAAADMRRTAADLLELALHTMSEDTKTDWEASLRARRSSRDRDRAQMHHQAAARPQPPHSGHVVALK